MDEIRGDAMYTIFEGLLIVILIFLFLLYIVYIIRYILIKFQNNFPSNKIKKSNTEQACPNDNKKVESRTFPKLLKIIKSVVFFVIRDLNSIFKTLDKFALKDVFNIYCIISSVAIFILYFGNPKIYFLQLMNLFLILIMLYGFIIIFLEINKIAGIEKGWLFKIIYWVFIVLFIWAFFKEIILIAVQSEKLQTADFSCIIVYALLDFVFAIYSMIQIIKSVNKKCISLITGISIISSLYFLLLYVFGVGFLGEIGLYRFRDYDSLFRMVKICQIGAVKI